VISPCSSHAIRNWRGEHYAAVAEHATQRGWRVVLMGGRSAEERAMGDAIAARCTPRLLDLIGKDTMKQMVALLARADLLLSPDSGPVHIANAVGTPVLGLYACTDGTRSGPYSDGRWTVNHYEQAALQFMGRPARELGWGQRVEKPGVMDLIGVAEVAHKFDAFAAQVGHRAL
jgi:heptosyltransferase I